MIRVGIVGGMSAVAGELIRILINHPDVELLWVVSPETSGTMVSSRHKGLQGETYMRFSSLPVWGEVNALFLCLDEGESKDFMAQNDVPGNVKIIDLSPDFRLEGADSPWIYGLPELNRKPLVRGASWASVPGELSTAVVLALLPMAKNLLLNSDIHVSALVPAQDVEPGETLAQLEHEEIDEIKSALSVLQTSFRSDIRVITQAGGWRRGLSATVYMETPISLDEISNIYDEFYEDHNFTFMVETMPNLREVVGTNKCILHVEKVGGYLVVTVAIDNVLKGSAGTAVHDMNLLFGLSERVGLMLKVI